jgi:sugar/nucleoside kinase (ribokinase family)
MVADGPMTDPKADQQAAAPLLVVGSVALDTVQTATQRRDEILGGAACFSCCAASFFAPARLVGVVGSDFPAAHEDFLHSRGIDLGGLERAPGRTFRWSGRYAPDFNTRTTLDTQLNVFETFRPKLPPTWTETPFVFLANIDPVLQLGVLEQVKRPRFAACDTMNFWIGGKQDDLLRVLARVDMLLLNDEEARQLSGQASLPAAARIIAGLGPKAVVIKRGDAGALLFQGGDVFAAPAFPLEHVVDPTGAGDSFAGGFMGYLAATSDTSPAGVRSALVAGTVLASFCVEDFSLDRFRSLDQPQLRDRIAAYADLLRFVPPALSPSARRSK